VAAFQAQLRERQASLTEATFREQADLAARFGLPSPSSCLDPAKPVSPALLAYLQDRRPEAAAGLTCASASAQDYRSALAGRWWSREEELNRAQVRLWLRELWATGSARLPRTGLARLGPLWTGAAPWLATLAVAERPAALAALDAALDPASPQPPLLAELTRPGASEANRLLAARILLARRQPEAALALLDEALKGNLAAALETGGGDPAGEPAEPAEAGAGGDPEVPYRDPLVTRLEAWLAPFRAAGKVQPVTERYLTLLAERRRQGRCAGQEWALAFRLTPASAAPALVQELDAAWFRGELPNALGELLGDAAAALGPDLPRWLSRWPDRHGFAGTRERIAVLTKAKDATRATATLLAARDREPWTAREEVLAFDLWRRLGSAGKAPETWTGAAAVWTGATPLASRLSAHPRDVLAARAALRNLSPADEDGLARAAAILTSDRPWAGDRDGDLQILALRALRGRLVASGSLRNRSLAGADSAQGDPETLARLLTGRKFKPAEIDASLADLARVASQSRQEAQVRALLSLLAERNAPGLPALRAELAPVPGRALAIRGPGDKPAAIRPRDLTWALLGHILDEEGAP
jgi:hypothetical protein